MSDKSNNEADYITSFKDLFEHTYYDTLMTQLSKGEYCLFIDFADIAKFDPLLANELLDNPIDILILAQKALEQFDIEKEIAKKVKIRILNIPEKEKVMIRNIRSDHIGKFIVVDGTVKQKTDVRPQVSSAKFECPACGNTMQMQQNEQKFREPSKCNKCGRKGKFHLLDKVLVDAQGIILEEMTTDLEGGEQPKRLNVFLQDDLVSPISDRKTNPGASIRVVGIIKEVPKTAKDGGKLTKFDLLFEANSVEPLEEDYGNIVITPEQEEEIKELSRQPDVYEKLVNSVAPGIYGHDKVKEAILLQFLGGCQKRRSDGVKIRGDIHILLIGDPGSGKSMLLKRSAVFAPKSKFVSGKGTSGAGLCVAPHSTILTNPGGMQAISHMIEPHVACQPTYRPGVWKTDNVTEYKVQSMQDNLQISSQHPASVWKLQAPNYMYKITTSSGKTIELTGNTQLFSIYHMQTFWKKAKDLAIGDYIATPRKLIGGNTTQVHPLTYIHSNPVIHNVKHIVAQQKKVLIQQYGSIDSAAKALGVNPANLYYNWVNPKARGNIRWKDFQKIVPLAHRYVHTVSVYNGKTHTLPQHITSDFLYVAGLLAGDGDIRKSGASYSIRLSSNTVELQDIFKRTIQKEYGLQPDIQQATQQRPTAVRFHSVLLQQVLGALGVICSPKSERISMSDTLLHFSNEQLAHYLAGLYDADGSVCIHKNGSDTIELYTCSHLLAKQVQLCLLRWGIYASIRTRPPTAGKIISKLQKYVLTIRAHHIQTFKQHIPLRHPQKKEKLAAIQSKKTNTNIDIIPTSSEYFKQKHNMSIDAFQAYCKTNKVPPHWHVLAQSDLRWEQIIDVQCIATPYSHVYDFTIEGAHNFVCDGIIVHNTAAVVRDEFLGGWALEAGALVLANRGVALIDELDKMTPEDRSAMHEALEQQTVSISKANIQATLRCETTVLAAANPKLGRFDPYESVARQIDLPPALITRFDLIFPIRDLPSKEGDEVMAKFILHMHKNAQDVKGTLSDDMLRRYIVYARQHANPEISTSALAAIKEFYVKMRNSTQQGDMTQNIPISPRQLEALIRMTEASAKARLAKKASKKDALKAIELLNYCLGQISVDPETGKFDIDRISSGISGSQRSKIINIREIIKQLEEKFGKTIPMEEIIAIAAQHGMDADKVEEAITKLRLSGDIYEPKRGFISRI